MANFSFKAYSCLKKDLLEWIGLFVKEDNKKHFSSTSIGWSPTNQTEQKID